MSVILEMVVLSTCIMITNELSVTITNIPTVRLTFHVGALNVAALKYIVKGKKGSKKDSGKYSL